MNLSEALKAEIASYPTTEWSGEIGGVKCTLYARPISAGDVTKIRKVVPSFPLEFEPKGMVEAIVLKAEDGQGKPAFTVADKPLLNRLRSGKIVEIYTGLFGDGIVEDEDAAGERVGNS